MADEASRRGATDFPVGGGGAGGPFPVAGRDQLFACWVGNMGSSRAMAPHAPEFYQRIADLGCNATELWMLPWLDDTGYFQSVAPWVKLADGRYDLEKPSEEYWDLKLGVIDAAQQRGLAMQLCFFDLYGCAKEKQGYLWVPDRDRNPVRYNVNGVKWGDPTDDEGIYFKLPDWVLREFIAETLRRVPEQGIYLRTANESPEKPMHQRIASEIRRHRPDAYVICNRQNNNTGQHENMVKNGGLDGIEFHNFRTTEYINTVMPGEVPDNYPAAWADANPRNIYMSTDGCRNGNITDIGNSYAYTPLGSVLIDHKRRGFNYSHQSDRKMCLFIQGRWSWAAWDNERRMLERVAAA